MRRLLVVSLALLLLVVPTGAAFAGKVPIGGGRELYLKCRGSGSPTVVLEAGLRNTADVWSTPADENDKRVMVYQGVGRFSRVCAYDRPGTTLPPDELSRSTPVRQPRTTTDAADDLHRLIVAARLKGPFVLVGHSTGGLIIRRFAAAHPRDVAGMVEVDAISEGIQPLLEPAYWSQYNQLALTDPPPSLASYADLEYIDYAASFAQMRRAQRRSPLQSIPLVVLSHGQPFALPDGFPPAFPAVLEDAWAATQVQLAHLVPGAEHVVATRSSHYIQVHQPGLVRAAIRRVVDDVRAGRRTA